MAITGTTQVQLYAPQGSTKHVLIHPETEGKEVLLTGYTKGTSGAAVAATDTANVAIGKLENQITGKVSKTGDTVTGALHMGNSLVFDSSSNGVTMITSNSDGTTYTRSTIKKYPAESTAAMVLAIDSGGAMIVGGGESGQAQAAALAAEGRGVTENLYLTADKHVYIKSNCNQLGEAYELGYYNNGHLNIEVGSNRSIILSRKGTTKGTAVSSNTYWELAFCEENPSGTQSNYGLVETQLLPSGTVNQSLYAYNSDANSTANARLGVTYDKTNNTTYGFCPTPATGDVSNKIATTEWVNSRVGASDVVHVAGTETVTGAKYFNSTIYKTSTADLLNLPSGTINTYMCFRDTHNDVDLGCVQNHVTASVNRMGLMVRKPGDVTSGIHTLPGIFLYACTDGSTYATCPTPAAGDNSTKIATTAWVKANMTLNSTARTVEGAIWIA